VTGAHLDYASGVRVLVGGRRICLRVPPLSRQVGRLVRAAICIWRGWTWLGRSRLCFSLGMLGMIYCDGVVGIEVVVTVVPRFSPAEVFFVRRV